MFDIFSNGFLLGLSLIAAIGAQNMFIIKQGLSRNHIFAVCFVCFICDAALMASAVFGVGEFLGQNQIFSVVLGVSGAIFLICYGVMNFITALRGTQSMSFGKNNEISSLKATLVKTLAVTLLNPHVYLDTVVMVGAVAVTISNELKIIFLLGLVLASFAWFFSLGYAAKALCVFFENPKMWQILNFIVGCVMLYIAWILIDFVLKIIPNLM